MDKYVLFVKKDAMLFVRYMLVCMCVCESRIQVFRYFFNKVKT